MLEEKEERSFNPLVIGLFGAIVIAAVVAILVQYRTYNEAKNAFDSQQAASEQQIEKLKKENGDLNQKVDELQKDSKATVNKLQRDLQSRVAQLKTAQANSDEIGRAHV